MKKHIKISLLLLTLFFGFSLNCIAQEGFYTGFSWNTYFAKEKVNNADNTYQFTHSNAPKNNGFLTQSLGDYGIGIQVGFRKDINNKEGKNIITLDGQYYYNYQKIVIKNDFNDFEIETKANFNHGYRIALGHKFNKIHPYLIVQAIYQNINSKNSSIENNGIIYDVEDDGTILPHKIDNNGGSFSTAVFSFLGGFGLEYVLSDKFTFNLEYVPMKQVEYGIRDVTNEDNYFVNNLTVNQLQVGVRYYFADLFN